jgi:5-methylcytosine-specific restriction endonuclease McrA
MTKREKVKNKYGGRCAYSGTILEDDWQVDHLIPKIDFKLYLAEGNPNDISNLVPVQGIINHYKRGLSLEDFRNWYLGGLHKRLKKLPKRPRTEKSKKHKAYMLKIANYFGITEDKPFNKEFYFENYADKNNRT